MNSVSLIPRMTELRGTKRFREDEEGQDAQKRMRLLDVWGLPEDIWIITATWLERKDLLTLELVAPSFNRLSNYAWRELAVREGMFTDWSEGSVKGMVYPEKWSYFLTRLFKLVKKEEYSFCEKGYRLTSPHFPCTTFPISLSLAIAGKPQQERERILEENIQEHQSVYREITNRMETSGDLLLNAYVRGLRQPNCEEEISLYLQAAEKGVYWPLKGCLVNEAMKNEHFIDILLKILQQDGQTILIRLAWELIYVDAMQETTAFLTSFLQRGAIEDCLYLLYLLSPRQSVVDENLVYEAERQDLSVFIKKYLYDMKGIDDLSLQALAYLGELHLYCGEEVTAKTISERIGMQLTKIKPQSVHEAMAVARLFFVMDEKKQALQVYAHAIQCQRGRYCLSEEWQHFEETPQKMADMIELYEGYLNEQRKTLGITDPKDQSIYLHVYFKWLEQASFSVECAEKTLTVIHQMVQHERQNILVCRKYLLLILTKQILPNLSQSGMNTLLDIIHLIEEHTIEMEFPGFRTPLELENFLCEHSHLNISTADPVAQLVIKAAKSFSYCRILLKKKYGQSRDVYENHQDQQMHAF